MDLLLELKNKSGLTEDELSVKIKAKQNKYKDLLNEETAAFLVAKELGVEIDDATISLTPLNIVDDSSKNINIFVNVKRIFPKKDYDSKGKTGFYYNLIVFDNTAEMRLTVWNTEVNLNPGDIILIKNVSVVKYKDGLKLNTSWASEIKNKGHKELTSEKKSITDLKVHDSNKIVEGIIRYKKELKYFDFNDSQRAVIRFSLYGDGAHIPVVAWGALAEQVNEIEENSKISLNNIYVKDNRGKMEVHLSDKSSIDVLEKGVYVPVEIADVKISQLAYDLRSNIKGELKSLIRMYNADVCKDCGTKMELKEGRFYCLQCNDYKETTKKTVLVYEVEDDSAKTNCVFFTKQAMVLLGADETNLDDKIHSFSEFNKEVSLQGFLKKTKFADEFIVSKILAKEF